jgi:hypothetical protein
MAVMTRSEVLDRVACALLDQGEPSVGTHPVEGSTDVMCRYRLTKEDGTVLKCGIGHLIPDELYDERMEGQSIGTLLWDPEVGQPSALAELFGPDDHDFLLDVQDAHDGESDCESPEPWRTRIVRSLRRVAYNRGVTT